MPGEPKGVQEVMDHLSSAIEDVNRILGLQRTRGENGAAEPRGGGLELGVQRLRFLQRGMRRRRRRHDPKVTGRKPGLSAVPAKTG